MPFMFINIILHNNFFFLIFKCESGRLTIWLKCTISYSCHVEARKSWLSIEDLIRNLE